MCSNKFFSFKKFFKVRSFINRLYCVLANEKYEISNSFRSLMLETKIKNLINENLKRKIINSSFCNKDYIDVNFNFKKRIIYQKKSLILQKNQDLKFIKLILQVLFLKLDTITALHLI